MSRRPPVASIRRPLYDDPEKEPRKCRVCGVEGSGSKFATGRYKRMYDGSIKRYRDNQCQKCKTARARLANRPKDNTR